MKRVQDVDYVEYYVRYGPEPGSIWLRFMFGPFAGKHSPSNVADAIKWTSQKWGCHGKEYGTDLHGVAPDDRRWRTISIPFGFAAYDAIPATAADYFDRILDTMCCGEYFYRTK